MSLYMNIPFPEKLPDDIWFEKYRQIQWLSAKGLLGVKTENKKSDDQGSD